MTQKDKGPAGETLEEFLNEVGIGKDVYDAAVKRVVAWQFEEARKARALTKKDLAETMKTSRSQVDRVLDPDNVAVSLDMLNRAALALGKRLKIELVDVK
ncbi:MAG: Fis family transcriptional regulator [Stellaceae bacterium]